VVTGSRAEYGQLHWLLRALQEDPRVDLQIVASAMHLSPEFGLTYREIERDGFAIAAKVSMLLSDDSPVGIAKSTGLGVIGFADAFDRLRPDIVVLLGDRFEILAAAQAALIARIPIAHLHGGETTEGVIDEAVRHAVTKMASLHFVAAEPYRQRVLQMGEAPDRVFNVGMAGLDFLGHVTWLARERLAADLDMPLPSPLFLVTYHPVTLDADGQARAMQELLAALDEFPQASIVLTYPNADAGGRVLIELIEAYARSRRPRVRAFPSLGHQRYLSLLRESDVVIGNSSSGLTEAPVLKKATVNLGDRQRGRLKAESVIDCPEERGEIAAAIRRALSGDFREKLPQVRSLYGAGGASREIARILLETALDGLVRKQFHNR